LRIDAVTVESNSLHNERRVDKPDDRIDITLLRNPHSKIAPPRERICSGSHKSIRRKN
jgi:hypothetical protein